MRTFNVIAANVTPRPTDKLRKVFPCRTSLDTLEKRWREKFPNIIVREVFDPSFSEVKDLHERGLPTVFEGGADPSNTVLGTKERMWYYRAWHDSLHIRYNLDFSIENELRIAEIQMVEACHLGASLNTAKLLRDDLYCHIMHLLHTDKHPDYQLDLIHDYREMGDSVFTSGRIY